MPHKSVALRMPSTSVLESHGHAVTVVDETAVKYVVYEDEAQIVAKPLADTRPRPTR
jgi:hypothetical protein